MWFVLPEAKHIVNTVVLGFRCATHISIYSAFCSESFKQTWKHHLFDDFRPQRDWEKKRTGNSGNNNNNNKNKNKNKNNKNTKNNRQQTTATTVLVATTATATATTTTVGRPVTARRQGTKSPWHGGVQCLFPHACRCFATRSTATLDLCPNQTCGVDHGTIGLLGPVYHIYIYHIYIYIYIYHIDTIYIICIRDIIYIKNNIEIIYTIDIKDTIYIIFNTYVCIYIYIIHIINNIDIMYTKDIIDTYIIYNTHKPKSLKTHPPKNQRSRTRSKQHGQ